MNPAFGDSCGSVFSSAQTHAQCSFDQLLLSKVSSLILLVVFEVGIVVHRITILPIRLVFLHLINVMGCRELLCLDAFYLQVSCRVYNAASLILTALSAPCASPRLSAARFAGDIAMLPGDLKGQWCDR